MSTKNNKTVKAVETGSITSSAKSGQRSINTRAPRSLREKVLTRERVSERPSKSEEINQPPLPEPHSPTDIEDQRTTQWITDELPPRPIASDDELSETSSISDINVARGRPSFIHITTRRTGIEMDAANKLANEMLQRAKDALEAAGNMKRECKQTALECLQSLYETVLALSDSRSRHKHNLEKERSRHAQELVRIERAHTRTTQSLLKDLGQNLSQAREDITANIKETKAVRNWLGYETQEPYKKIEEIARSVVKLETSLKAQENPKSTKEDTKPQDYIKVFAKLETQSNQLDDLRRNLEKIKTGTDKILESETKVKPTTITKNTTPAEIEKGFANIKCALKEVEKNISDAIVASCKSQQQNPTTDIKDHLQPITEGIEEVKSEIRTMRQDIPHKNTINLGAEIAQAEKITKPTYAQMAQKARQPKPNHTLIVSSTDPNKSGDNVIDSIREVLDLKKSGAKLDRVRKGRNQKVILSCSSKDDLTLVQERICTGKTLKVEVAKTTNPLAKVKDVMAYHSDAEIEEHIRAQNKHLLQGLENKDSVIRVRYRKRARNPLECHPVLELSPEVHKRFVEEGKIYIGLQRRPIVDQSPLVQCTKCLGFGHTRKLCKEDKQICSYCGDNHEWEKCNDRIQGKLPTCNNCIKNKNKSTTQQHNAFSEDCPEKQKWDSIARSRVTYC